MQKNNNKKKLPLYRPPLYGVEILTHLKDETINKAPNLAWLCKECDKYVHGKELPKGLNNSKIKKIEKYKAKLN